MHWANWRFRFGVAIGALAAATAAGLTPSLFAPAAASPSSTQVSQHDQLIQAAQSCHQLALFQISQSQTDAETRKQSKEATCKGDPGCFRIAEDAYNATLTDLQQKRFAADGVLKKEIAAIGYAFSNMNGCPQACSSGMRAIYSQPVAQLSCSQLASQLGISTTP